MYVKLANLSERINSSKDKVVPILTPSGDGLFGDIRNQLSILMAQIQMNKSKQALETIANMSNLLSDWEHRLRNGENWDVSVPSVQVGGKAK